MSKTHPEIGFVEVNGTKLHYEVMGEGHPLVLLHGGYMDRHMWDDQFAVFACRGGACPRPSLKRATTSVAPTYKVIRYDIRGFGKTEMPNIPYSDVQDLYELLKHLHIEKTYLLGLSLGGMITIDFTLEHPDMVDGLILVGTGLGGFEPNYTEEQMQEEMQRWAPFDQAAQERDVPRMVDLLMQHPTLVPAPKYASAQRRVRENLSKYSFVFVLDRAPKQEIAPPAVERLAAIRVPVLIIVGDEDALMLHQIADKLEADIPHTRRTGISDTRHMPNMEKPEEFNTIVLDFLSTL